MGVSYPTCIALKLNKFHVHLNLLTDDGKEPDIADLELYTGWVTSPDRKIKIKTPWERSQGWVEYNYSGARVDVSGTAHSPYQWNDGLNTLNLSVVGIN